VIQASITCTGQLYRPDTGLRKHVQTTFTDVMQSTDVIRAAIGTVGYERSHGRRIHDFYIMSRLFIAMSLLGGSLVVRSRYAFRYMCLESGEP
jgi:hypothetical protein